MLVLRPVQKGDLDQIYALANMADAGITTLPKDKEILNDRLQHALASFSKHPEKPAGEDYWFMLEDLEKKQIVGSSAVFSKVGGFQPSYSYKLKTQELKSEFLKVSKEIKYLELCKNHDGPTEIGSLLVAPQYRKTGAGKLAALGRYLFMAQFESYFEDYVIAEMRGRMSKYGQSEFWDAIGRHFFGSELKQADLMTMTDKSFIADLVPQHPIYISLLPKAAQDIIGKVHSNTEPAANLLIQEGFKYLDEIDIFDGGPVLGCEFKKIKTIRQSKLVEVVDGFEGDDSASSILVSNTKDIENFRVIRTAAKYINNEKITLSHEAIDVLGIAVGDRVRVVDLESSRAKK